jgi:hypothetical protein
MDELMIRHKKEYKTWEDEKRFTMKKVKTTTKGNKKTTKEMIASYVIKTFLVP